MQRVRALAKLTLSLRVTGVRDDGYHQIDQIMLAHAEGRKKRERQEQRGGFCESEEIA